MAETFHRVAEFFLLRDLEERSRAVPEDERTKAVRAHALAKQKRDSAEALWSSGFPAEALRLVSEAAAALGADVVADLPLLDADVTETHGARFRELVLDVDRRLDGDLARALTPREVKLTRVQRMATAAAVGLVVIFAAWFVFRTPRVLRAEASGQYDARYEPGRAVDGNDKTDWLLPDKTGGWVDVHILPPRKVTKLKITNARNLPWSDRATNEFHVDAFYGSQLVKSADGKFDGPKADPVTQAIDVGAKIDRVRVTVKSWYQNGGGFAEIEPD